MPDISIYQELLDMVGTIGFAFVALYALDIILNYVSDRRAMTQGETAIKEQLSAMFGEYVEPFDDSVEPPDPSL